MQQLRKLLEIWLECKGEKFMHTFEGKSCRIHHNSDMSGEIYICDKNSDKELVVEGQDILDFVADYVISKKIANLEKLETEYILMGE